MADLSTLAMARRELEELYLGIPDDSVNLTFGDLANVQQQSAAPAEKSKSGSLDAITETNPKKEADSHLGKLPSLDFSKALAHSNIHQHQHRHVMDNTSGSFHGSRAQRYSHGEDRRRNSPLGRGYSSPSSEAGFRSHAVESSRAYDEMSNISGTSVGSVSPYPHGGGGGRRRPGIPHSNICTVCSTYIYICRHRCLVCGRAYCRQCVGIGMGEMTEGRKCIECLGRRFSQRYIQRAGQIGCCIRFRYPSIVAQQELKWAEKGPRKSGERRYGQSTMTSRSRSPVTPRTPTSRAHASTSPTPSFVMNSPYSTYSPTNHPLPF
ncbi:Extra-large guanine nucleotide-binding protein like [Actinidia chinensis var. chinensis]|uniref:Extra-large guanine nucleotide-binding protein like n=1 Tax=Actinidia chinensis var. chinensis TaxID=1590841 RepID=A0A2R6QJH4_ACTCC|nr:Extra-large guanine nucleotide-binding protein like [Actinidia chinensis var. chinensis]